jgi:hypothetical protein
MQKNNEASKEQFKIKRFHDTSSPITECEHLRYLVNSHHNFEDLKCKSGRLEMQ